MRLLLPLALLLFTLDVAAQDGRWETHTSFRETNDLVVAGGVLWVASSGGVYRYDPASGERTRYTVVEGMHGTDARALSYDTANDILWVGYGDGVIDRLNVETGAVRSYFDIRRAERFTSRAVVDLDVRGDSLYILTDFGIVIFDARPGRLEVRDTYAQLGLNTTIGVRVNAIHHAVVDGVAMLYAGTVEGVASARLDSPNLQDPAAWTMRPSQADAGEILSVMHHAGTLYAGAVGGLYTVGDGGQYDRILPTENVRSLRVVGDRIIGVDQTRLIEVVAGASAVRSAVAGYERPILVSDGGDGRVWVGDAVAGVAGVDTWSAGAETVTPVIEEIIPDGPYHGQFSTLHVADDGTLWASGVEAAGTGVYRRSPDGRWTSFVGANYPEFQTRSSFMVVDTDADGNLWAGSHGNAIVRIDRDDNIQPFDRTNSALTPIQGSTDFTVVRGIGVDAAGNVWASNVFGQSQLVVRSAEGEWTAVQPSCPDYSTTGNVLHRLYIDSFGNKWFIVVAETNLRQIRGVMVYDSGPTPGSGDDECRFFRTEGGAGQGLPSIVVRSVAEDRDGRIWLGTNNGPAFTPNSRLLPQSTGEVFIWPQPSDRSLGNFLLYGVQINSVTVDAANRIWFGTENQGVYVVEDSQAGGFDVVAHFTPENSPLLSELIVDIAADGRSGRVFIATSRGLISYDAGARAPAERAGDLRIYPNPARIVDDVAPAIRIEGLVEATELRIVTATGELIQQMSTRGGQVTWDGRDRDGRLVRSGMYLVIAVGNGGEGRGVGKVAIIR